MKKIVFLESLGIENEQLKRIIESYIKSAEIIYYNQQPKDKNELITRCQDADAIVLAQLPIDKEVIEHCHNLKYICVAFTGTDHIDKEYCRQRNIVVSNSKGYSTAAVADLVFATVLNILRKIDKCDEAVRKGKDKTGLIGEELEGKTFGIIGLGDIGTRVAKIADAFGCNVIAYNRHKKNVDHVKNVELSELLQISDIISLHVPSNSETKHMIGENELKLMKRNAILVNCARGAVVDNEALTEALNSQIISYAAVDVYDYEPPLKEDYCLLKANNCLLTPHIGFATKQAFVKRAHIVGENLKGYIDNNFINVVSE